MITNMNTKMTTYNYQQLNLKIKNKNKLSKQLEQKQNHINGYHREGYQQGVGGGNGGKVQGINCWYKIKRGKLRIVREVEKPKKLYE